MSHSDTTSTETETAPNQDTDTTTDETADEATSPMTDAADGVARETLQAQLRTLEAENNRLRTAYAAAQRSRYRRTAIALCLIGVFSGGVGLVVPTAQRVLLAIGATGVFAGVMTYYLSPTEFVAATIGDRLVEANVATLNAFVQTLGLSGTLVYVPTTDTPNRTDVIAFLPQATAYIIPSNLTPGIVPGADASEQGIATVPVGGLLLDEFTRALTGEMAREPAALGEQLGEAITDQFELAATVDTEVDLTSETTVSNETNDANESTGSDVTAAPTESESVSETATDPVPAGRLTVVGTEPVFATAHAYDHPVGSFVASGIAVALDRPVELQVDEDPASDVYQATISWDEATE